jgi:hypothetical protein
MMDRFFPRSGVSLITVMFVAASVTVVADEAETYYLDNIESSVQAKCINCHRSGGQAGSTPLRFTSSALGNHDVFDSYVNNPSPGARANTVLTKIRGGAGHGGGVQVSEGSSEYQKFSKYMELLSAAPEPVPSVPGAPTNVSATAGDKSASVSFSAPADNGGAPITTYTALSSPGAVSGSCAASPCSVTGLTNGTAYTFTVSATNEAGEGPASASSNTVTPVAPSVFRIALEEPVNGEIHSGVGNLRGWAVASSGITKVEILVDGVYAFDAPYGASRGDVGGAFPDVEDSENSGYSLAYAYSLLSAGEHTITARAHSDLGATIEKSNTFTVVKFRSADYISDPDAVDLNSGSCSVSDDEIWVTDALVDGLIYDLKLKWRVAEQGFEIIEAR